MLLVFVLLPVTDLGRNFQGMAELERVLTHKSGHCFTHVIDLRHLDQDRNVIVESTVVWVVIPGDNWEAALRLEHVGGRRVVDDHGVLHGPAQLAHILDEDAVDEGAVLAEEAVGAVAHRIHHIHQGVRILKLSTKRDN